MIDWRMDLRREGKSNDENVREMKNFVITIVFHGGKTALTILVDQLRIVPSF
jgi:hypothetical protein